MILGNSPKAKLQAPCVAVRGYGSGFRGLGLKGLGFRGLGLKGLGFRV